jgi:hypothetical protein
MQEATKGEVRSSAFCRRMLLAGVSGLADLAV